MVTGASERRPSSVEIVASIPASSFFTCASSRQKRSSSPYRTIASWNRMVSCSERGQSVAGLYGVPPMRRAEKVESGMARESSVPCTTKPPSFRRPQTREQTASRIRPSLRRKSACCGKRSTSSIRSFRAPSPSPMTGGMVMGVCPRPRVMTVCQPTGESAGKRAKHTSRSSWPPQRNSSALDRKAFSRCFRMASSSFGA